MIYLLSDPHGKITDGLRKYEAIRKEGDLLILLGDIGMTFAGYEECRRFLTEEFLHLSYPIAFIDGNHEDFAFFNAFPEEDYFGGRVHRLTENIVHLMRGYVFTIEGKTLFTMGGCKSSQKWWDAGLATPLDDPSEEEITRGYDALKANGNRVDYILTHKYKREDGKDPLSLSGLIEYIDKNVDFKKWYSGHWHCTAKVDEKHFFVFDDPMILS